MQRYGTSFTKVTYNTSTYIDKKGVKGPAVAADLLTTGGGHLYDIVAGDTAGRHLYNLIATVQHGATAADIKQMFALVASFLGD